jgi:prephenate dehydratase
MSNIKATVEVLNGLHDQMATYFTQMITSGERLAPGELSAVLKFLKDNEITADVVESKPMANLIQNFLNNEDSIMEDLH